MKTKKLIMVAIVFLFTTTILIILLNTEFEEVQILDPRNFDQLTHVQQTFIAHVFDQDISVGNVRPYRSTIFDEYYWNAKVVYEYIDGIYYVTPIIIMQECVNTRKDRMVFLMNHNEWQLHDELIIEIHDSYGKINVAENMTIATFLGACLELMENDVTRIVGNMQVKRISDTANRQIVIGYIHRRYFSFFDIITFRRNGNSIRPNISTSWVVLEF